MQLILRNVTTLWSKPYSATVSCRDNIVTYCSYIQGSVIAFQDQLVAVAA